VGSIYSTSATKKFCDAVEAFPLNGGSYPNFTNDEINEIFSSYNCDTPHNSIFEIAKNISAELKLRNIEASPLSDGDLLNEYKDIRNHVPSNFNIRRLHIRVKHGNTWNTGYIATITDNGVIIDAPIKK
jgi:hypothetical protein